MSKRNSRRTVDVLNKDISLPGLHLSHYLPWHNLVDYFKKYKHPTIELPVGQCGKIHKINNKVKHKVKNCKFLEDKICQDETCDNKTVETACFRKSLKTTNNLFGKRNKDLDYLLDNFVCKYESALQEFGEQFMNSNDNICYMDEETYFKIFHNDMTDCYRCDRLVMLIETKNIKQLNLLTDEELQSIFWCLHGGQAVGRNLGFLMYHVNRVYFLTNIIYASNNINNVSNWHYMKPSTYHRTMLNYPCDGQTFPPTLRKYLSDDVYLKDLNSTKELCKKLFEFICIYKMLERRVYPERQIQYCKLEDNLEKSFRISDFMGF